MSRTRQRVTITGTWERTATRPGEVTEYRSSIPLLARMEGSTLTVKASRPAIKGMRGPQTRTGTFKFTTEVVAKARYEQYSGGVRPVAEMQRRALRKLEEMVRDVTCVPPKLKVTKFEWLGYGE